jgi:hypothetical protein
MDDGFSCTEAVCTAAGCLQVPVDSRCVPPGTCTDASCEPERPDADAAGCVRGASRLDGQACAEDADACTTDVCRGGACVHERTPALETCAQLQGVFKEALGLDLLARDLLADIAAEAPEGAEALVSRLTGIQQNLNAAARALAGEQAGLVPAVPIGAEARSIAVRDRARIAFTHVLRTPRQVAAFLRELAIARERAQLSRALNRPLRLGGRRLLKGTRSLKSDLRRLQRRNGRNHAGGR